MELSSAFKGLIYVVKEDFKTIEAREYGHEIFLT